jgi:hypothetical protein
MGRTVAHEFGHMMGADDVGTDPNAYDYFEGIAAYEWYPRMGNYWNGEDATNSLFQWSKGDYANADNTADMLALISRYVSYRDDDIPDTTALTISETTVSSNATRTRTALLSRSTPRAGLFR